MGSGVGMLVGVAVDLGFKEEHATKVISNNTVTKWANLGVNLGSRMRQPALDLAAIVRM